VYEKDLAHKKNVSVSIFLDALNIDIHAKKLLRSRNLMGSVDYRKILEDCIHGRRLMEAIAYTCAARTYGKRNCSLAAAGFSLRKKRYSMRDSGGFKCDWDIRMALDAYDSCLRDEEQRPDVIVLVTGDGDFLDLMKKIRNRGSCVVEVVAFRSNVNRALRSFASSFLDLESDPKYLNMWVRKNI